jgi:hypothetical protein
LEFEIAGMKSAVAAPADLAWPLEKEVVNVRTAADPLHGRPFFRRAAVLGDLEAVEILGAVIGTPPGGVARIERVRPRDYLAGVVDGDDPDAALFPRTPDDGEVDELDAWPSGDDDADFASPVWEPARASGFGAGGFSGWRARLRAAWRTPAAVRGSEAPRRSIAVGFGA